MPTYGVGNVIREMRTRLGYTQEELAFGICTTGTLSRIENGNEIISRRVFEALCSRMPGMHHVFFSFDTKKEMQRSKLCKQTLLYLALRKLPESKAAMKQYRQLADEQNPFCIQFQLYTEAIYQAIVKEREEEILPKLKNALKITLPDYQTRLHSIRKPLMLTYDELYILSNMGIAYAKLQDTELAFHILYLLKGYIETQDLDVEESMTAYPMILGNFAWLLELQGRFEEAVKQCDIGIHICDTTGRYTVLPHLLCIKAWCLTASGCPETAKKSRQQAKAILDISDNYKGYGSFQKFYKAREPIYVTF